MSFAPGEAYQFDWSHETITLQGLPLTVKAAHMKVVAQSDAFCARLFRETRNWCSTLTTRHSSLWRHLPAGIYDNMKTAVEAIFVGKARRYNRRFLQMCSHHLIEPVACTPRRMEKGQVENQVGNLATRCSGQTSVKSLAELTRAGRSMRRLRQAHQTSEFKDRAIWDVFQEERPSLMELRGPSTGSSRRPSGPARPADHGDHNRYSVDGAPPAGWCWCAPMPNASS